MHILPRDILRAGLYPARPQTWNLGRAKAPGFDDRKRVHISNIDPFTIVKSRELSRGPKSKFVAARGIIPRAVYLLAEYALRDINKPMGVAEYETKIDQRIKEK